MKELLKKLLEHKVAIYDTETNEEIKEDVTTVEDITSGFDFYIEWNEEKEIFELVDMQDEDSVRPLGATIYEVLHELNQYTEYFNDLEEWESQFLDYFKPEDLTEEDRKKLISRLNTLADSGHIEKQNFEKMESEQLLKL